MTSVTKIQIEAIKMMSEMKTNRIRYAEGDGAVYLIFEGRYAFRIPEEWFWLDRSKLGHMNPPDKFFGTLPDTVKELTFRYDICDGKTTKSVLGCDEFDIWLKADLFKTLRLKSKSCKMYAANARSLVYFVLNGKTYAVCRPLAY